MMTSDNNDYDDEVLNFYIQKGHDRDNVFFQHNSFNEFVYE